MNLPFSFLGVVKERGFLPLLALALFSLVPEVGGRVCVFLIIVIIYIGASSRRVYPAVAVRLLF